MLGSIEWRGHLVSDVCDRRAQWRVESLHLQLSRKSRLAEPSLREIADMRKSCMSAPPARRMHRARPIKRGHFALGSRMAISHIINHNIYSKATMNAAAVPVSFARPGRCKPQSFPRKACPELAEGREFSCSNGRRRWLENPGFGWAPGQNGPARGQLCDSCYSLPASSRPLHVVGSR